MTIIPVEAILKASQRGFINLLKFTSCGDCVWIAEIEVNTFFAILLSIWSVSTIAQQKIFGKANLAQLLLQLFRQLKNAFSHEFQH